MRSGLSINKNINNTYKIVDPGGKKSFIVQTVIDFTSGAYRYAAEIIYPVVVTAQIYFFRAPLKTKPIPTYHYEK